MWRAASRTGEVKTQKSRRSLVLPQRAMAALMAHRKLQAAERLAAGPTWQDNNLVFCHEDGRMYTKDALNWRFSKMTRRAGIGHWHAHEGRHTAVSIMSSNGIHFMAKSTMATSPLPSQPPRSPMRHPKLAYHRSRFGL